jgi:hypothetical protein
MWLSISELWRLEKLIDDAEADVVAYVENALLQSGYSVRVKDAIIRWYLNQP